MLASNAIFSASMAKHLCRRIACAAVSRSAQIAPCADVHERCFIADGAVVAEGATLGEGSQVGANAVVGPGVCVGGDSVIGPGATVMHCRIGERSVIHAGVRIGQDGFGFVLDPEGTGVHLKKRQEMAVVVGDDVEIGANSCVDRGSWRDTTVGNGVKIDNLVQIGHNVDIGDHCIIAAMCGVGGSANLGKRVYIGAMTGVLQWITVGDGAKIAARSGVMADIPADTTYGGSPAVPIRQFHRQTLALKKSAA